MMQTELENIQQQVNNLQENTDLITQDIVRVMPNIVSLLSANEKAMQEFHDMRAKDQELLHQIKQFIKRENDILSEIIKDYGSLQDVVNEVSTITRQEFAVLTNKEKEIVSKISEIPDGINIKHHYGIDLKSTPLIIIMIALSIIISLGLGVLLEKNRQISDKTSYEMRYRMMGLELPNITSHIDSIYTHDPNRFHDLVTKREEEQRLINSIERKRSEIKDLDR